MAFPSWYDVLALACLFACFKGAVNGCYAEDCKPMIVGSAGTTTATMAQPDLRTRHKTRNAEPNFDIAESLSGHWRTSGSGFTEQDQFHFTKFQFGALLLRMTW